MDSTLELIQTKLALRDQRRKKPRKKRNSKTRKQFIQDLMTRAAGQPIKKFDKRIEFCRRILQLLLLAYHRPLKSETIYALVYKIYKFRNNLLAISSACDDVEISYDQFIAFCFWHINKFPMKIKDVMNWIVNESFITLRKYESSGPEMWDDVMCYALADSRGKKLMRLVEVKQDVPKEGGLKKLISGL